MYIRLCSRPAPLAAALVVASILSGCGAGGGGGSPTAAAPARASDAVWRQLATPRPEALADAPRIAIDLMELGSTPPWVGMSPVGPALGVTELFAAGLLGRREVDFVERRRFSAAAESERKGEHRPGAPSAGVSRGPDFVASVSWMRAAGLSRLDVRLRKPGTGEIATALGIPVPADADPVSLARAAVAGTLAALDSLGVRPAWQEPAAVVAPGAYQASGIPAQATSSFMQGLAAEEAWSWEAARIAYQRALDQGGASFLEAAAALARTARLRNGGTLGAG
jgi:hypothetical protein